MGSIGVSVVIPVGPSDANKRWLTDAINSALDQTVQPEQLIIVDDGANLHKWEVPFGTLLWKSPWRLGVASAFNVGVGLSPTNCVFMLGSDDTLEETCLENCLWKYGHVARPDLSYFWVGVRYSDGREDQYLPCHAAMVTQTLWRHTGGLPIEASTGASDAALISIMWGNSDAGDLICVNDKQPLYNHRIHPEQDTASKGEWQNIILATRDLLTREWGARRTNRDVINV